MPTAAPTDQTTLNLPVELRGLWYRLLSKSLLVSSIVAAFAIAGTFLALRLPKLYQSTTTVQVDLDDRGEVHPERNRAETNLNDEVLKTIEQNFLSPALALRLVRDRAIHDDPGFLPRLARPATEEQMQGVLSSRITAIVRKGTRLIDVSVEAESPALAQKLAQALVREYLAGSAEGQVNASQSAHADLLAEAERLKGHLAKSERALQAYREQSKSVSLEDKQNIVVERLKELNARVTTAKGERLKLETDLAQWEKLRGGSAEALLALPSISGSDEVAAVRRKISDQETEIAALSGRYKSEHPKYIQAAGQLAELQSSLGQAIGKAGGRLGASVEAARTVESKLEEALQSQEQLALELSQIAIPYQALDREVVADRALYDALLARLKESEVGQAASPQSIRVVAPALLPDNPSKPNKRLILLLAVFAGGAIALSLVLVLHLMDGSLTTVDQAERALGLRSLGAVPLRPKTKLAQAGRLLIDRPHTAVAEAFRGLRTALHFAAVPNGGRTVLVTSAVPGEGKSFCAINYAVALAQQGFSTLLIDLDLRLPSIGPVFLGREPVAGATDLLRGACTLAQAVHATTVPNLSILPAGGRAPNPAELIGQGTCAALLQQALTKFERIVIDTAPIHAVAETLLLAPEADAVCLVVRAGSTQSAAVVRAVEVLRQTGATLPGFVLNGLPMGHGGYYYHYQAAGYGNDEVYGGSGLASRA